jgi:hypothetical protein
MLEPIFIAANVREAEFVEKILDEEGIEYSQRLEAFMREGLTTNVCYQGILFEVLEGQAGYCRKILAEKGLERGVV